ncbi:uncharacterized protein [Temnothorax nylanderi]|uniref:uncharacterized protein n=1 Tax=Temnothorax nylanderi TaxID=102681 RepID=UPI003A8A12BD
MDKISKLKGVCELAQIQATSVARATDDLHEAVLQLQHRLRNIVDGAPPCLQVTIRVDEDAGMFDRIGLIGAVLKKSRNHMRLYAARIRSMYRDAARLDSSAKRPDTCCGGNADNDNEDNNDDDDDDDEEDESGRGNIDINLIDVDFEDDVVEGWPSVSNKI